MRFSYDFKPDKLTAFQSEGWNSSEQNAPDEANDVTVFPHSDNTRYYLGGQANIIFQAHPPFHSPYQGPNSLNGAGEYKTSLIGTFYTAFQPHRNLRYNTDLIVDVESAGGRGLSQALGLAGFTNVDVVRNPNLGSTPYLARGEIHQTIGLTNEMVDADRSFLSLATKVPVRRFDFRIGKMTLPDLFDINSVGSDSHLQFANWTVVNNGAWDYAADTRGYTVAAVLEYDDRNWSARYGFAAMPTVANGIDLDWAFSRAHGQNMEYELRRSFIPGRHGVTRILSFVNKGHMGIYRDAINNYFAGITPTPQIDHDAPLGTVKYGFGWNNEQEITSSLRVFSRFGWNEGQHESFCYTEVDQTVLFGADYNGSQWHRPVDKIGVAFVSNAIKKDHQIYLAEGGLGFLLGDGRLNYGRENIVEAYYNRHIHAGLFGSIGLHHIDHPGYNRDRGPVWVPSVRMHVDF
ncbi:MAG TPA: carbohydrate porin [Silvibacterium sp.]|nr:carbohydrate porin [Silvibacterium sp.]